MEYVIVGLVGTGLILYAAGFIFCSWRIIKPILFHILATIIISIILNALFTNGDVIMIASIISQLILIGCEIKIYA